MFYIVFQTALILLSPAADSSGDDTNIGFDTSVSTAPGNRVRSSIVDEGTSTSEPMGPTITSDNETTIVTSTSAHKPVTKTRRVTEYPRNDEDRIDRTIYVNRIDEAFLVLKREIEVYVRKGDAANYSLMVLEENFEFRRLITISELFSISKMNHDTIGLDFNQKLLLHNRILHQFELWWMIRPCSHLASNYLNKCRVITFGSNDILVNVPSAEAPKTILLHNGCSNSTSFTKITGISADEMRCYCKKHRSIVKSTNCLNTASVKYLLLTINSSTSLQLFTMSSNSPSSIRFKVLDVSQIISIDPLSPSKDDISVDLVQEKTSLLVEFTSRHITNKTGIYIISCSTYDGRNNELCELTTRNVSLPKWSRTKLLPRENVIMNIKTARSASYLLTYYSPVANRNKTVTQVIETSDRRYMGSACFNDSLVGCKRNVSYTTQLGNTSFDPALVKKDVKSEQTIVVCNATGTPIILCTPRLIEEEHGPSHIGHVPRDKQSVLLLGLLCGCVVLLLMGAGCVAYKLRKLHLERKCEYHTYMQPECDLPSLEVDYAGIEVLYSDH